MTHEPLFKRLLNDYEALGTRTNEGCLLWKYNCVSKHSSCPAGYGQITVDGKHAPLIRVVYHYFVDPTFPIWSKDRKGPVIDHKCRVTNCYEPSHLQVVVQRKNVTIGKRSKLNDYKTSIYTGVSWNRNAKKWQALIYHSGRLHNLGYYTVEREAGIAYKQALVDLSSMMH